METMDAQPESSMSAFPRAGATRKRDPNFTADEKALIAALVKKRPIVESKQTDSKSVEKKKLAWDSISAEFNSNHYVRKRDTLTLKRAWDNMKAIARKARAAERGNIIKNGGPSIPPQQGALMEEAVPVICEIQNSFDSDGVFQTHDNKTKPELSQAQTDMYSSLLEKMIDDDLQTWEGQGKCETPEKVKVSQDVSADEIPECDVTVSVDHSTPRPIDYVRREALMRMKHLESKNKMEMRTLEAKLEVQDIKIRAAKLEEETNKINLEIAKFKFNDLKRRLEN